MSCWEPHIDLMRLLEALGREIIAASELEIRQACTEEKGRSIAACRSAWPELHVEGGSSAVTIANEVRELIEAVGGDPSDPFDVEKRNKLRGLCHILVPQTLRDHRLLALARKCRDRAEEILARAETFNDADAREGMRRIAAGYEESAERLEREAGRPLG
jgi:hypothetical protein